MTQLPGSGRAASGRPWARLRSTLGRVARGFGLEIHRYVPLDSAGARRARILTERRVGVVLDVGASTGQYAKELRLWGYGGRIVSFEPVSKAFAQLQGDAEHDPNWECRRLALDEVEGPAEIHVSGNLQSSSLLPMKRRHLAVAPDSSYVAVESVTRSRLDSLFSTVVADHEQPFLKLDVQGCELRVLNGAEKVLHRIVGIEAELSLTSLYEGQPLLREMLDFFASAGFILVALEPVLHDPESGHTLQVDGIFVRSDGV